MPKLIDCQSLARIVSPSELVYVPGASGAPLAFMEALSADPENSRGLRLLTSYVPGVNSLSIDSLHASSCVTGLFMQPQLSAAQLDGRYRHLPLTYAGFMRHLSEHVDIDLAVVQVAPPNADGMCSLGPAVEFMPTVLRKSRRVLGLVNKHTPALAGATAVPYTQFDYVCEVATPLATYKTRIDDPTLAIARHIAALVPDGATLQIGLGKVPAALSEMLRDHRRLRLYSGMLSDGLLTLSQAGALDPDFTHTTCVLLGSETLYEQCTNIGNLRVAGCEVTHDPRHLLDLNHFFAVNAALEVDLFGQCNLEHASGRAVSGAGGAPDFARAARLSSRGRSIVALNASGQKAGSSRIVPCLADQAVTSLSRCDVDHVVTEHGVANLAGLSVHERAKSIIAVAAPEFREALERAWHNIAARL